MEENSKSEQIDELIQMVEEFRQKIKAGTKDPENFLTITDIERLWSELRKATNNIYAKMLTEVLSEIDETELIRKKKQNTEAME